jgi:hypothetical protein
VRGACGLGCSAHGTGQRSCAEPPQVTRTSELHEVQGRGSMHQEDGYAQGRERRVHEEARTNTQCRGVPGTAAANVKATMCESIMRSPMCTAFRILRHCLSGRFVPFAMI